MIHYIFDLDDTIIIHENKPIHYDLINENTILKNLISNLNEPCYIYTNGTGDHAVTVLKNMKLLSYFDKIYSRDTIPHMKPLMKSFQTVQGDIQTRYTTNEDIFYFFDDLLENLKTASELGWITFWIHPNYKKGINYSFVNMSFPSVIDCLKYLEIK